MAINDEYTIHGFFIGTKVVLLTSSDSVAIAGRHAIELVAGGVGGRMPTPYVY
jgi:hypothetical protein